MEREGKEGEGTLVGLQSFEGRSWGNFKVGFFVFV